MIKRLGDICTFVGGGTPSKKNPDFFNGSIPWATVRDMNVRVIKTTEHSITPDAVQQSATNIIPQGEVVISTHVGLGKVCFLGQDTAINQDLKAVIPNGGLSRRYLYYWFVSKADELIANGKGATVKGVTLDFVKNLKIQVMPEREQETVSDTLDKVNRIIPLADSQVARLDQLVKSRFVEMFGDEKRFPSVTVGDVFTVQGPKRIHKEEWTSEGVPFYRVSNLSDLLEGRKTISNNFISRSRFEELKAVEQVPETGDVLVTARGTLGRCYVVKPHDEFYFQDGMITWLADRSERITLPYFLQAVQSQTFKRQYEGKSSGTTVAYMTIGQLAKYRLPLPPLVLQREFAAFVEKVDKLAFAARQRRDIAQKLYRAKMQEFFG